MDSAKTEDDESDNVTNEPTKSQAACDTSEGESDMRGFLEFLLKKTEEMEQRLARILE